jgi:hypothetical protein
VFDLKLKKRIGKPPPPVSVLLLAFDEGGRVLLEQQGEGWRLPVVSLAHIYGEPPEELINRWLMGRRLPVLVPEVVPELVAVIHRIQTSVIREIGGVYRVKLKISEQIEGSFKLMRAEEVHKGSLEECWSELVGGTPLFISESTWKDGPLRITHRQLIPGRRDEFKAQYLRQYEKRVTAHNASRHPS